MTVAQQLEIVQAFASNYSSEDEDRYIRYLNAEMLLMVEAYPHKVLQETALLTTVAGQLAHLLAADCARVIHCRRTDGAGGTDGKGTILVMSRDFLTKNYPNFYSAGDEPLVMAPWGYDGDGVMEVYFNAKPDGEYEMQYDYFLVTAEVDDGTDEMAVTTDLQYVIALRASKLAAAGNEEALNAINDILREKDAQLQLANEQGPDDGNEWQFDQVTLDRRGELYSRLSGQTK